MKTIIFDIDGTLTDLWPLECAVLQAIGVSSKMLPRLRKNCEGDLYRMFLASGAGPLLKQQFREIYRLKLLSLWANGSLPKLSAYPAVSFIFTHREMFRFVYSTGGIALEAEYALENLGILNFFDLTNSIARDTYHFSKATYLPFKRMKRVIITDALLLVTDSEQDKRNAQKAGIQTILLRPDNELDIKALEDWKELFTDAQIAPE